MKKIVSVTICYIIIHTALALAVAYESQLCMPWPLPHSFELAGSIQSQLFHGLGMSLTCISVFGFSPIVIMVRRWLYSASGKVTVRATPLLEMFSAVMVPPLSATMLCAIESPRP